jgi:membrane protease YdiL (CAAX protease family)
MNLEPKDRSIYEKIASIVTGFGLNWIWIVLFSAVSFHFRHTPYDYVFQAIIVAPLIEEFVFRVGMVGWTKDYPNLRISALIFSSAVFGFLHGGWGNIFIQGAGGLVIGGIYIRNNYCYWSAVSAHALWNLFLVFL